MYIKKFAEATHVNCVHVRVVKERALRSRGIMLRGFEPHWTQLFF